VKSHTIQPCIEKEILESAESWKKMRAIRFHHRNRIILKRYERVRRGLWYVKGLGYFAKNNTVCSCWMCGNPRKYFGEVTVQERKFNQTYRKDAPVSYGALFLGVRE